MGSLHPSGAQRAPKYFQSQQRDSGNTAWCPYVQQRVCVHPGFNAALCTQPAVVKTAQGYRADTQVVSPQELLQAVSKSEMF